MARVKKSQTVSKYKRREFVDSSFPTALYNMMVRYAKNPNDKSHHSCQGSLSYALTKLYDEILDEVLATFMEKDDATLTVVE
jgi:hypothetical protein